MKFLKFTLFILSFACLTVHAYKIPDVLEGKLVELKEGKLVEYEGLNTSTTEYYAFYFSAHWCPPCRQFTPKLVKLYDKLKRHYDNFEVILVSSDRSEEAMREYMEWGNMKWPALKFNEIFNANEITQYAGPGIPCLVIVDKNGTIKADSYLGGTYIGPVRPMEAFELLIKGER